MSHSQGEVWTLDGQFLRYYEYDGTSDHCRSRLYRTQEEMQANWRGDNWRDCTCVNKIPQIVIIYSSYGHGWYWLGQVCLKCEAITDGRYNEDVEFRKDGHPFPGVEKLCHS